MKKSQLDLSDPFGPPVNKEALEKTLNAINEVTDFLVEVEKKISPMNSTWGDVRENAFGLWTVVQDREKTDPGDTNLAQCVTLKALHDKIYEEWVANKSFLLYIKEQMKFLKQAKEALEASAKLQGLDYKNLSENFSNKN